MTKDGPSVVRWALSVIVDMVMRCNCALRSHYLSLGNQFGLDPVFIEVQLSQEA